MLMYNLRMIKNIASWNESEEKMNNSFYRKYNFLKHALNQFGLVPVVHNWITFTYDPIWKVNAMYNVLLSIAHARRQDASQQSRVGAGETV